MTQHTAEAVIVEGAAVTDKGTTISTLKDHTDVPENLFVDAYGDGVVHSMKRVGDDELSGEQLAAEAIPIEGFPDLVIDKVEKDPEMIDPEARETEVDDARTEPPAEHENRLEDQPDGLIKNPRTDAERPILDDDRKWKGDAGANQGRGGGGEKKE